MGKPDAPTPPDPRATAAASTGTNVATAVANAFLGNVNQNTPGGSLQFDQTGFYDWTDPFTGSTYNIPRFTATQNLSPAQQAIYEQQNAANMNIAGMSNQLSGLLGQHLADPFSIGNAPASGNPNFQVGNRAQGYFGGNMPNSITTSLPLATTFDQAGPITTSYQDFAGERNRIEEGLMQRLNPQLERERGRTEQQLANQGIRYGSQAYGDAIGDYGRQANDARLAVIGQAGQEQSRMDEMAARRAGFQNAAQMQQYQQNLGRATFGNQAMLEAGQFGNQANQQAFQQELGRATFANSAAAQNFAQNESVFNAQNMLRNQYLNEQYALRNQPINEVTALLSGSQVSNPMAMVNAQQPRIPTTDVAGIINQNFAQQMGLYQQQSQNANQLMGGIFGLAGGLLRSDENVKQDIQPVGSVLSADGGKSLPIYTFAYKDDPTQTTRVGPMAQDVQKIDKKAVKKVGGVKHIDTARLGAVLKMG